MLGATPLTPPPNLSWRRMLSRVFVLNQVLVLMGTLSFHAAKVLSSPQQPELSLLDLFVSFQCVALTGLLITASTMLGVTRWGWRRMPDPLHCHEHKGVYRGLAPRSQWLLLITTLASLPLAAWLAQQLFTALQHTPWGLVNLSQAPFPFTVALFNSAYGTLSISVLEYFHDRAAVSEARERLAQKLSAQAQLKLLRSQLDPHMLFNTLSNLHDLIDESPQQAQAMLMHIIGFMRSTLQGSRVSHHALSEEFRLAADYLSLMQVRMGDRLSTSLELPEALRDTPVPSLLLQPLIENAIKHGLEPRKQGGELHVVARHEAGALTLRVSNSGGHGQPDTIAPDAIPNEAGGFGLRCIQDRLQALYGERARLEWHGRTGGDFTEVRILLPLTPVAPTTT